MGQKMFFTIFWDVSLKKWFLGIMVLSHPGFNDTGRCPMFRSITRDPSQPLKPTNSPSFWDHFGMICESFWDHFVLILDWFWDHSGIIFVWFWDHFEIILGWFWNHFGMILESFGDDFGVILVWFWGHFGMILDSFCCHFGMIFYAPRLPADPLARSECIRSFVSSLRALLAPCLGTTLGGTPTPEPHPQGERRS